MQYLLLPISAFPDSMSVRLQLSSDLKAVACLNAFYPPQAKKQLASRPGACYDDSHLLESRACNVDKSEVEDLEIVGGAVAPAGPQDRAGTRSRFVDNNLDEHMLGAFIAVLINMLYTYQPMWRKWGFHNSAR
jgi:hypothetical protein